MTNGSALTVPANDEFDLVKVGRGLPKNMVFVRDQKRCSRITSRYTGEEESSLHGPDGTIWVGFEQAGLGSLAEVDVSPR